MKRKLFIYLLLLISICVGPALYAQDVYKVKNQKLNVRSQPSLSGKVLGTLTSGTLIEVESIDNGWAQFIYKSQKAFVSTSYLELTNKDVSLNDNKIVANRSSTNTEDIDYSSFSTPEILQDSLTTKIGDANYTEIPGGFWIVKYDHLKVEKSSSVYNGISVGILSSPLNDENKKSSFAGQFGLFLDYYWDKEKYGAISFSSHYFGISSILHLLGWQFSNGKGNGIAIHGGFEFTWRIAGGGNVAIDGFKSKSINPFDEDDMGDARLKHLGYGFSGAADIVLSDFYASIGYKLMTPIIKETNSYGLYFAIGYNF